MFARETGWLNSQGEKPSLAGARVHIGGNEVVLWVLSEDNRAASWKRRYPETRKLKEVRTMKNSVISGPYEPQLIRVSLVKRLHIRGCDPQTARLANLCARGIKDQSALTSTLLS